MNRNYQKELDNIIAGHGQRREAPTLFLHSCCAPCSSYVLEYLSAFFRITVFYYNPNIYPAEERFYEMARGLEQVPEGGERCFRCYELRLRETARLAAERGFDYFTTTLTISPLKNAAKLNEIGGLLGEEYQTVWLPSDFKKKNGYKRSIELSKEYNLYRQDYCGCVFSVNR